MDVFQVFIVFQMRPSVQIECGVAASVFLSGYSVLNTVRNVRGWEEEVTILCIKTFRINIQERYLSFPLTSCLPRIYPLACPLM